MLFGASFLGRAFLDVLVEGYFGGVREARKEREHVSGAGRNLREDRAFTGGQDGGESKLGRREREGGKQRKKRRKKEKGATEREQREWEDIRD